MFKRRDPQTRLLKVGLSIFLFAALVSLIYACENTPAPGQDPPLSNQPGNAMHGVDLWVDANVIKRTMEIGNLFVDPGSCVLQEGCVRGTGTRRVLRFTTATVNLGDRDLVFGDVSQNPLFEWSACHGHYHMTDYLLFELIDPSTGNPYVLDGGNVMSRKLASCIDDSEFRFGSSSGRFDCGFQGISVGWADVYETSLPCQWLDITDVPAGNYTLRVTVNPDNLIPETNTTNNVVTLPVTIPSPAPL